MNFLTKSEYELTPLTLFDRWPPLWASAVVTVVDFQKVFDDLLVHERGKPCGRPLYQVLVTNKVRLKPDDQFG